jgi:hypothetical protein
MIRFYIVLFIYKPTRNRTCLPFLPFLPFLLLVSSMLVSEYSESLLVSAQVFLFVFFNMALISALLLIEPAEDGRAGNNCCKSLSELVRGVEDPLHGVLDCIGGKDGRIAPASTAAEATLSQTPGFFFVCNLLFWLDVGLISNTRGVSLPEPAFFFF